ncbi:MAG TPA: hypothetical protein VFI36_09130 [Arthrobacter sp.]|nr:hypothetical protein [Arthrobacter sp.]
MTATLNEATLDAPVDVRFTAAGTPLAVRHEGRPWAVAADPVHWFTRDSWWETRDSVPAGIGNVVDIEHWRVQVKLSSNSVPRTFELRLDPLSEQWLVASIDDGS